MDNAEAPLEGMNISELLQILKTEQGHRVRRGVPVNRIIHLIRTGEVPDPKEIADTTTTRKKLEVWIGERMVSIGSQLPCSGDTRGKCTQHPCSDGKHLDCYLAAKDLML